MRVEQKLHLKRSLAPLIRLEDYARRPERAALPIQIKVALLHVWRTENEPRLALESCAASD